MKILEQRPVTKANINAGEFNNCQHLFLELTPNAYQTISCRLPSGKHVTFAFVPSKEDPNGFECVDIHSTVGKHWTDTTTLGRNHYQQHAIGFGKLSDPFDTRKMKQAPSLITLLLAASHHPDA